MIVILSDLGGGRRGLRRRGVSRRGTDRLIDPGDETGPKRCDRARAADGLGMPFHLRHFYASLRIANSCNVRNAAPDDMSRVHRWRHGAVFLIIRHRKEIAHAATAGTSRTVPAAGRGGRGDL